MITSIAYAINNYKIALQNFRDLCDRLGIEKVNEIPAGYKNNVVWNLGHVLVVQQLLVYRLSGLPVTLEKEMLAKYGKGSAPEGKISKAELDELFEKGLALADATLADYENGTFKQYKPFTTSFGQSMNNVDEAILFNTNHAGVHFGYSLALAKNL